MAYCFKTKTEVGADLSAARGKVIESDGTVANAATDVPIGICDQNAESSATSGISVPVVHHGQTKAIAGAAVSKWAFLTMDSSGRVIATSATTDVIVGQALEAADAANDLIEIFVNISAARGS